MTVTDDRKLGALVAATIEFCHCSVLRDFTTGTPDAWQTDLRRWMVAHGFIVHRDEGKSSVRADAHTDFADMLVAYWLGLRRLPRQEGTEEQLSDRKLFTGSSDSLGYRVGEAARKSELMSLGGSHWLRYAFMCMSGIWIPGPGHVETALSVEIERHRVEHLGRELAMQKGGLFNPHPAPGWSPQIDQRSPEEVNEAEEALAEHRRDGGKTYPLKQIKEELRKRELSDEEIGERAAAALEQPADCDEVGLHTAVAAAEQYLENTDWLNWLQVEPHKHLAPATLAKIALAALLDQQPGSVQQVADLRRSELDTLRFWLGREFRERQKRAMSARQ